MSRPSSPPISPATSCALQDALQRIDSRGGTALYDAIGMSLDHLKEKAKWDKQVLLIVTDGEDNAGVVELEELVRRLQETDTVIYAVGLLSEKQRRSAKRATRAIRDVVWATGGAAFFPKGVHEVNAITQRIAQDNKRVYTLTKTTTKATLTYDIGLSFSKVILRRSNPCNDEIFFEPAP